MILVPVKNLAFAKQRLASILDQASRTQLAQAMLFDILSALEEWPDRPKVGIVTDDAYAKKLAARFGYEVIEDHHNEGETAAIEMATQVCVSRGEDSALVIPGDIPLVRSAELQAIMDAAPQEGCVLSPAADGRGTNAILRRPGNLFPLRFGNDSFKPHLAAARSTQKPCIVLTFPGIGLDIDNPADLRDLAAAPGSTHSQCLVREWNLSELPLAANE